MTFANDKEAYCLANTYGLCLPRIVYPCRLRLTNPGKYEPDHFPASENRCMVLAHFIDKTNIIVQYDPDLNFVTSCHVTGTLSPNAVASYVADGFTNEMPAYSTIGRTFVIFWDGVDSWILSEQWAGLDNPHWKRTNISAFGVYSPLCGATGIATVVAG